MDIRETTAETLKQSQPKMKDRVTIFLRCDLADDGTYEQDYRNGLLQQKDNIKRIQEEMEKSSRQCGREPPEIVVSVLLVPKDKTSYDAISPKTKSNFFERVQVDFSNIPIIIENVYEKIKRIPEVKAHLIGLEDIGSVIDLCKIVAIISNMDRQHLQMDSNTIVTDWKGLYDVTFGQERQEDTFTLSRASMRYIAPTSKLIYTTAQSNGGCKFGEALQTVFIQYLTSSEAKRDKEDGTALEDAMYEAVYGRAMYTVGAATIITVPNRRHPDSSYSFYPAKPDDDRFRAAFYLLPAYSGSWSIRVHRDDQLWKLPKVRINEILYCNFILFRNLVFTFTDIPMVAPSFESTISNDESRKHDFDSFIKKHNQELCYEVMKTFWNSTLAGLSNDKVKQLAIMQKLSQLFPDTEAGNALCQNLFQCDVKKLWTNPTCLAKNLEMKRLSH